MKILKTILVLLITFLLTVLTQVGGLIFLISFFTHGWINKRLSNSWKRLSVKIISFIFLYLFFILLIVPLAAKPLGRVPLPLFKTGNLKPGNIWTCLLNRNYVKPQLRQAVFSVAEQMSIQYPGTTINFLDANFPFIDKFPLLPHLSHNDGRKLDLSFQYNDVNGQITNEIPSFIGYGICEEPKDKEENKPKYCESKGYWQYNVLRQIVPQRNKNKFIFDEIRTRELVNALASQNKVGKIFIEPHLKTRLKIKNSKIRFHGCQAVRHDDHIHVQLK